jgi:hypothetical protein
MFEGPALATSTNKPLKARLEKNTVDDAIAASMVIAQGLADVTVPKYLKPQPLLSNDRALNGPN